MFNIETFNFYDEKLNISEPNLTVYKPFIKVCNTAIIIFSGGGYAGLCDYEGDGYARYLSSLGITSFVVKYRVSPNRFPLQLIDARTAVRFVRSKSSEFGIDKDKVLVMGSSAGGHLVALVSTYLDDLKGEPTQYINENFLPNGQILCYPVISCNEEISHKDSYLNLLGEEYTNKEKYSPELIATSKTPKAFFVHSFADSFVNVQNSLVYAEKLKKLNIPFELHVFENGEHGFHLATSLKYVSEWRQLLINWLTANGFYN